MKFQDCDRGEIEAIPYPFEKIGFSALVLTWQDPFLLDMYVCTVTQQASMRAVFLKNSVTCLGGNEQANKPHATLR